MTDTQTLLLGRIGLKEDFVVEASEIPDYTKVLTMQTDSSTQTYELYRTQTGFGLPDQKDENARATYDDMSLIYTLQLTPLMYAKAVAFSYETRFTDQYNKVKEITPYIAHSFMHNRNTVAANLLNNGFTVTTQGVNSEAFFSSSHSQGAGATPYSNLQTPSSIGPYNLAAAKNIIRKQFSPKGQPVIIGKNKPYQLIVPIALEDTAERLLKSVQIIGTNNNDTNAVARNVVYDMVEYLTSDTAWFLYHRSKLTNGVVWLDQIPYEIERLAMQDDLAWRWVGFVSYAAGWFDVHGTCGNQGQ